MSNTQKPMALILADKYEAHGFLGDHRFAKDEWCSQAAVELRRQHARIAELDEQMAACIELLKRTPKITRDIYVGKDRQAWGVQAKAVLDAAIATRANQGTQAHHKWVLQAEQELRRQYARIAELEAQLEESTHTTKNGVGGKWLTVVYHDIQPGDESRSIGEHPKVSAMSWSHALHDRDAAIAAQAKQGEQAHG